MALPVHMIGNKQFLQMDGLPAGLSQQVELLMRPGVADVAVWLAGLKGQPFQVRTLIDQPSVADCRTAFQTYLAMKTQQHTLQFADYDFAAEAFEVLVLDVAPVRPGHIQARKTIVGGLNVGSGDDGFYMYCNWTLIETSP